MAADPLREAAHRALMELYACSGDRSAAIRQYEACARVLREELGVEPSPETTELYARIRGGELRPSVAGRREPVIRGYEIRERIGADSFGVVYRAYQPHVGREVAVKAILPRYANHPDFIRRFETESQLVAWLEHPHIVPLYDFGIAKDLLRTPELTQTSGISSSPAYLSPEQIQEQPVTPLSDIYSLGVVLYELLTGAHPFPAEPLATLLVKHLNEPLPPVRLLRPELPPAVDEVIQRATAKDPAQRFPDALTLANAFRQALTVEPGMVGPMISIPVAEAANPEYSKQNRSQGGVKAAIGGVDGLTEPWNGSSAEAEGATSWVKGFRQAFTTWMRGPKERWAG